MFKIKGIAMANDKDAMLMEKLSETLKNEGFTVKKDYFVSGEYQVALHFCVEGESTSETGIIY